MIRSLARWTTRQQRWRSRTARSPALPLRGTRESAPPIGTSAPFRALQHSLYARFECSWQAIAKAETVSGNAARLGRSVPCAYERRRDRTGWRRCCSSSEWGVSIWPSEVLPDSCFAGQVSLVDYRFRRAGGARS
jgi:hypothetical protein